MLKIKFHLKPGGFTSWHHWDAKIEIQRRKKQKVNGFNHSKTLTVSMSHFFVFLVLNLRERYLTRDRDEKLLPFAHLTFFFARLIKRLDDETNNLYKNKRL